MPKPTEPPPGDEGDRLPSESGRGGGCIVNLALDEELERAVIRRWGMTSREGIDRIVDARLARLIEVLVANGFTGEDPGRVKPRRMSRMAWNRLQAAAEVTGLHASLLLRACCRQEAQADTKSVCNQVADPTQKEGDPHQKEEGPEPTVGQ